MSYQERMKNHLSEYKVQHLGISECGTYRYRDQNIEYPHILPKSLQWKNILKPFREEVREYSQNEIKLHKYFHHLNSSQAFALNLFIPFFGVQPSERALLLKALGLSDNGGDEWHAEYVPDSHEGTNVDFAWRNSTSGWTYCEVKLTEQEFGRAKSDARHLKKLADIYRPVLCEYVSPELLEPQAFFESYQILRNIWLATRDARSQVIFLMPRENKTLWKQLKKVTDFLDPRLEGRVHATAIEDCLSKLTRSADGPVWSQDYASMLAEKYLPPAA
jgi:hypothetical protein